MKVAIVYQSPYGQTQKIAQQIKQNLVFESQFKDNVHLIEIDNPKSPSDVYGPIDMYIIGFPVYVGKFPKKLLKWVHDHSKELEDKRLGFFMVSLNAADSRDSARKTDQHLLKKLTQEAHIIPDFIASFAGALHYTKYGFIKKFILKKISQAACGPTDTSKNHELTDWNQVQEFSHDLRENNIHSPFFFTRKLSISRNYSIQNLTTAKKNF